PQHRADTEGRPNDRRPRRQRRYWRAAPRGSATAPLPRSRRAESRPGRVAAGVALYFRRLCSTRRGSALTRQQDQQFFDSFMLVIGILMGVGVGLFFLARMVAIETEGVFTQEDPRVQAAIAERIAPIGQVALIGSAEA